MAKKNVKVFLDSNVILSGLLSDKGPPRIILDVLSLGLPFLTGFTGRYSLIEIKRNLKKKMPKILSVYKKYLPKLNLKIIPLPRQEELREYFGMLADKDVPVLVSAIRSKADFLVTGDRQHFERLKVVGKYPLKIIAPSEFIDSILPEILKEVEKKK
jgi:putative PIN family toxin of toxin-antitoxin system